MLSLPEYVERLRIDLRQQRVASENIKRAHLSQKKKADDLEEENKRLRKENDDLKKENGKLKKEIEKLTKTNNRYQIGLFDHGNFKHPDQSEKKPKGGQRRHRDTNTDQERGYASFQKVRISANTCGGCGTPLNRTGSSKAKTLLDIELNSHLVQLIIQSERQWCGNCQKEVRAVHPQSLPFTEYGINTFMVVMYLRFKGKQSAETIAQTLSNLFGLPISDSGVLSLLVQAKKYLREKYGELKQAIRDGEIMYNDETGWLVRGKSACMWVMTSPDQKQQDGTIKAGITVYVAAESKGKGIFEEMYGTSKAKSMHDGNPRYVSVTGEENSLYCWSHMVRFAFEETVKLPPEQLACHIRDRLLALYQDSRSHPERSRDEKEVILREEFDTLVAIVSGDETANNILQRLRTQQEGLIQALLVTEDGTNNLAEREFRELVQSRHISFGSDTYTGMETTAILASILKTIHRDKNKPFLPTLRSYLLEGIEKQYPQYKHIPQLDS